MFSDFTAGLEPSSTSPYGSLAASRSDIIQAIKSRTRFDVAVIGGGIHGACFARLAALNGLKTVLFERADYACGTSSRSSKMAHGGLRYLELLDLVQVYEGIRSREDLFQTAAHLVQPQEFLIPVYDGASWFRRKLGLGLWLYDWMAKAGDRRHAWLSADSLESTGFKGSGAPLTGAYRYYDGIMRDTRLVVENIIAARQEGAACLNYARVDSVSSLKNGVVSLGWTDCLTGNSAEIETGIVVNCAGPWVATAGRLTASDLQRRISYSRGTHLLFDRPWKGPALFLPLPGKARYYWVWPHFAGTLVGTTEHEVQELPDDPQPTAEDVAEILDRLKKDLPNSGLDRSSLHYAFAGIRTLPLRRNASSPSQISRRHVWSFSGGTLSLVGGKFTTATWTAYQGLKLVFRLAGLSQEPVSLAGRLLPGAAALDLSTAAFRAEASAQHVPGPLQEQVVGRLGGLVKYFLGRSDAYALVGDSTLQGEVDFAIDVEQAETVEDVLRRRLELEYFPDHGVGAIPGAVEAFRRRDRPVGVDSEKAYLARLAELRALLEI